VSTPFGHFVRARRDSTRRAIALRLVPPGERSQRLIAEIAVLAGRELTHHPPPCPPRPARWGHATMASPCRGRAPARRRGAGATGGGRPATRGVPPSRRHHRRRARSVAPSAGCHATPRREPVTSNTAMAVAPVPADEGGAPPGGSGPVRSADGTSLYRAGSGANP
jgi:hypothetical protein